MLTAASGAFRYCLLAVSVFPWDPRLILGPALQWEGK